MSYTSTLIKRNHLAEVEFPLRKPLWFFYLLLVSSGVNAGPFEHQVEHDLSQYAHEMSWQDYQQKIVTWLPNKNKPLPRCQQPVSFKRSNPVRPLLGRVNYLISCAQPRWNIRAHAKIKVWLAVLHAKQDIPPGQSVTLNNSFFKSVELSRLTRGFISQFEPKNGQPTIAQRRIRAGKTITRHQLTAPYLIKLGEQVIIRAAATNFVATMQGKALQNGKLGARIMVENSSSKKRFQAKVVARGTVETLH